MSKAGGSLVTNAFSDSIPGLINFGGTVAAAGAGFLIWVAYMMGKKFDYLMESGEVIGGESEVRNRYCTQTSPPPHCTPKIKEITKKYILAKLPYWAGSQTRVYEMSLQRQVLAILPWYCIHVTLGGVGWDTLEGSSSCRWRFVVAPLFRIYNSIIA